MGAVAVSVAWIGALHNARDPAAPARRSSCSPCASAEP